MEFTSKIFYQYNQTRKLIISGATPFLTSTLVMPQFIGTSAQKFSLRLYHTVVNIVIHLRLLVHLLGHLLVYLFVKLLDHILVHLHAELLEQLFSQLSLLLLIRLYYLVQLSVDPLVSLSSITNSNHQGSDWTQISSLKIYLCLSRGITVRVKLTMCNVQAVHWLKKMSLF